MHTSSRHTQKNRRPNVNIALDALCVPRIKPPRSYDMPLIDINMRKKLCDLYNTYLTIPYLVILTISLCFIDSDLLLKCCILFIDSISYIFVLNVWR